MAKLTDKQRKKIIAEYVEGGTSQRKLAEKYHVSPYLIRSILNGDKNLAQKISHKKEENTPYGADIKGQAACGRL